MRWGDLRALRWAGASIVFQGALHSLNAVRRVGRQIAEPIRLHEPKVTDAEVERRVGELLEQVGLLARTRQVLPAPALRRSAAAGDDRDGARLPSVPRGCRRADDGARRDGAGAGARRAVRAREGARRRDDDHQPRPVRAGRRERPDRGDVRRPRSSSRDRPTCCSPTRCTPTPRALSDSFPRIGDPAARYAPSGLQGDPPDPRELPPGCSFAPRCPLAIEQCRVAEPPLAPKAPSRYAACIRVEES